MSFLRKLLGPLGRFSEMLRDWLLKVVELLLRELVLVLLWFLVVLNLVLLGTLLYVFVVNNGKKFYTHCGTSVLVVDASGNAALAGQSSAK